MRIGLPNIAAFWDNTVRKLPKATAAVHEGEVVRFDQAEEWVARAAGYLAEEAGVGRGDRVAMALPNCLEYLLTYWATLRLGAVVAPVNTRLRADELGYVLTNCAARALVVHGQPSWPTRTPRHQLDFILHSPHIRVKHFEIPEVHFSDHRPLICDFEIGK